ncbi:MAG: type I pullulanase [Lachnospiraceae bacterium]|nr:type I pullulanase [Lachnospiraceae bacterium]
MKKRIMAFLAVLVLLLSCVPMGSMVLARADDGLTLKLHYHREDGNYEGWDVWLWESGRDGAGYAFAEENGEMVATMNVTPGTTSIGFIVRTADWTKDVNEDQFIDIAEMISGTVHIYVESGVKGYTREYGEDAVTGVKLSGARYDGEKTVITQFTGVIEGDLMSYFKVTGPYGAVDITEVKAKADNAYHLVLSEELNANRNYTITCDGTEYKIVMPIIFSTEKFEEQYTYTGDDLGDTYTKEKTTFRVWAPTADAVSVRLYKSGTEGTNDLIEELTMTADINGTWVAEKSGDLNGTYYTYFVTIGEIQNEACDPYARTTGVNGKRAMVIDLDSTNPEGWDKDTDPNAGKNFTDAVIYEVHVRDLSIHSSSGITNKGKYLGLTETGTKNKEGISTGIDHIKELGVTHVHLLPVYDYGSVDESKLDVPQFNWGYDPVNYNVPEGSYSTDPYNGEVRVKEFKQMVKSMHDNGLSVIMDVVYNHVYNAGEFCFNQIVPQYFTRIDENGTYSNGSGCGNDTATERSMVKKYIVDSVSYWADEYHIDGFRFDLVGLMDTETINEIMTEVHKTHPNVVFYGEGWTMSTNVTKDGYKMTTQVNSEEVPGFAFFSDTIRDALKGSVFNNAETGYISGASGKETTLEYCFLGLAPVWCTTPSQCINYASCHDNMTLFDRIVNSASGAERADQIKMNNLAAAVCMTSQGIPFMQAGEEMLRTKPKASGGFDENSYASSDATNSLKWNTLSTEEYQKVFDYYKGLIAFRKEHAALRMTTAEETKANIVTMTGLDDNVMAFKINGGVNGELADNLFVIFNANNAETEIELPEGKWDVYINGEKAGTEVIETVKGRVTVAPISAMVLCQGGKSGISGGVIAGIAGAAVVLGAAVAAVLKRKKK